MLESPSEDWNSLVGDVKQLTFLTTYVVAILQSENFSDCQSGTFHEDELWTLKFTETNVQTEGKKWTFFPVLLVSLNFSPDKILFCLL